MSRGVLPANSVSVARTKKLFCQNRFNMQDQMPLTCRQCRELIHQPLLVICPCCLEGFGCEEARDVFFLVMQWGRRNGAFSVEGGRSPLVHSLTNHQSFNSFKLQSQWTESCCVWEHTVNGDKVRRACRRSTRATVIVGCWRRPN
jgi:hypothetical protein